MKRLRETPPDERLRNARRAVKRLRHEARYASDWGGWAPGYSAPLRGGATACGSVGGFLAGVSLWPDRSD